MKIHSKHPTRGARAYTLVEMIVTIAVINLVGGIVYVFLSAGMSLYAKNTAVNAAHQQARAGVDEMLNNVHASASIPALVSISTAGGASRMSPLPAPGLGPAEGIMFQRFDGGPFKIKKAVAAGDASIQVVVDNYTPRPTMRFNIPSHDIEGDVVSAKSKKSGTDWTVNFADPVGTAIDVDNTHPVTGFTTYRVGYLVVGAVEADGQFRGELRYYPIIDLTTTDINDPSTYQVVARNVTSPTPFQILLNIDGGVDNRSVAAVKLSTADPQYSNRGFAAVNMFINSYIPFRSDLTNNQ